MAARKATKATRKSTATKGSVNVTVKRVSGKTARKASTTTRVTKAKAKTKTKKAPRAAKKIIMREKQTRIEILQHIAEKTDLTKTQVESVFSELTTLIGAHVCKRGSGEITVPMTGIKIKRIQKGKTKARKKQSSS